eukprot:SAG22_NODE_1769_length_3615_cov_2.141354_1_plen_699_part_00
MPTSNTVVQSDNSEHFGTTIGGDGATETVVPVLDLAGRTARERGLSHGRQLSARIRRAAAAVLELEALVEELGAGGRPAGDAARRRRQRVERCWEACPQLMEEMQAVADGAGLEFDQVWAINCCRSWWEPAGRPGSGPGDESDSSPVLVCGDDGSGGGGAMLGWCASLSSAACPQRSALDSLLQCGVVVRAQPGALEDDSDPAACFAYVAVAGAVGGPGLGRHLMIAAGGQPSSADLAGDSEPWPLVCRQLLACKSVVDAQTLFAAERAGAAIMTAAVTVRAAASPCGIVVVDGTGRQLILGQAIVTGGEGGGAPGPERAFGALAKRSRSSSTSAAAVTVASVVASVSTGELFVARGLPLPDSDTTMQSMSSPPILRVRVFRPGAAPLPLSEAALPSVAPGLRQHHAGGLDAAQQAQFSKEGFIHLPAFFGPDEVAQLRQELWPLLNNRAGRPAQMSYSVMPAPESDAAAGGTAATVDARNPDGVVGVLDQPLASAFWYEQALGTHKTLAALASFLGDDLDFHNAKIRNKPPGYTNRQQFHMDWPYQPHSMAAIGSALTYLDPTTDHDSGATTVVVGSHLRGEWPTVLRPSHLPAFKGVGSEAFSIPEQLLRTEQSGLEWRTVAAAPGDLLLIHALVVHRAGNNRTAVGRHAIINQYKAAAAADRFGNRCAFAGLPLLRSGDLVAAQEYDQPSTGPRL